MSASSRQLRSFLCHSSGNKQKVRGLYERLRVDGFAPWLDEENLLPGQDWQQQIRRAVHSSDVVIVCLSRGSISKAGFVQKEIKLALDAADEQPEDTIFIIPVKLEECDMPERLRRWHWVDLFEEKGYERLIRALQHRSKSLSIDPNVVNAKDRPTTLLLPQHQSVKPVIREPSLPLIKTVAHLLLLRRSWLIVGFTLVLLISLIVAARLTFPHWFVSAVKPDIHNTQLPSNNKPSKVITPTDLKLKRTLSGHEGIIWSVVLSPDGELAASAGEDKKIFLWDIKTLSRKFPPLTGHKGEIYSIAFSPDGKTLASGSSDKTIKLWNAQTGQLIDTLLGEHSKPVLRVAFSPDGNFLASCSGDVQKGGEEIRLWDTRNGWKSKSLEGDVNAVFAIAFSPDSATLVSAGFDNKLRLWNLGSDGLSRMLNIDLPFTTIAFSSDGKYMACGSNNGTIWLYQPQTQNWEGQPTLLKTHETLITSIAFSPDNKTLVSCSTDTTIRLWDVETRTSKRLSASQGQSLAPQRSVAFTPDGQTLITGGEEKMVLVWQ